MNCRPGFGAWALTALLLATAGCGEGSYRFVLVYPDNDAYQRAAWVELYVDSGRSCDQLRSDPGAVRIEYGAHTEPPNLGAVDFGTVAFLVRVRDSNCTVILDGCSAAAIERGQDETVRIALAAAAAAGCSGSRQCTGGRCVSADGGSSDALVGDHAATDRPDVDARRDAGVDAAIDAAQDAAHDAWYPIDAGADGGHDAGTDAATGTDATIAVDAGPYPPAVHIYRSVGPGRTTPLARGTGNALTIAAGSATFGSPLPANVGVGDAIQYDSDNDNAVDALAFIHGRNTPFSYQVRDAHGALPITTTGDRDWSVLRAYTTLATAVEDGIENTGIAAALREFDSNGDGKDITAETGSNEIWHFACYADAVDTVSGILWIDHWLSSPRNYVHVFAPVGPDQVGVSQRHAGVWDDSKYRIALANDSTIGVDEVVARIEGLQIQLLPPTSRNRGAIETTHTSTLLDLTITDNILRGYGTETSYWADAMAFPYGAGLIRVANNIIYDFGGTMGVGIDAVAAMRYEIYNNTVVDCGWGIGRDDGTVVAKNNLVYGCTQANYQGTFDSTSTNNLSGPTASGVPPANARSGVTPQFVSIASDDFHLARTDTAARGHGADLSHDSSFAVFDDIDGDERAGSWDIGADQTEGIVVEPLYPAHGRNWNDWVTADGFGNYGASDTACLPSNWDWCLHAGELRQVRVEGYLSCSGRSLSDELGLLQWFCTEQAGGLTFYNTGLPADLRLADLVDFDHWRLNRVSFHDGVDLVARSGWRAWWSNPVTPLPPNRTTAAVVLDSVDDDGPGPDQQYAVGTIFTLNESRDSNGYNINLDHAAIAMPAGVQLTYGGLAANNCSYDCAEIQNPDGICLIAAGGENFLWLEGDYLGRGAMSSHEQLGIYLCDVWYSKVRSVRLARHDDLGFIGDYLHFSELTRSQAVGNGGDGFALSWGSAANGLQELASFDNSGHGLLVESSGENSVFSLVSVGNFGAGVRLQDDSNDNMFALVTSVNNGWEGIGIRGQSDGNMLFNLAIGNSGDDGIRVDSSTGNHFGQLVTTDNSGTDVVLVNGTSDTVFSQQLLVGGSPLGDCYVDAGSGNNIQTDCISSDPDLTVMPGASLTATFVGLVRDAVNGNTAQLDGSGRIAFGSISDWFDFENRYRGWANGTDLEFITTGNQGDCQGGTCAQRDVSLSQGDDVLLDINGAFVANAACPASIDGNAVWPGMEWILLRALEIVGDGVGDDDIACESDEACLYQPNLGAYQGSGDYRNHQCIFSDGYVSNVTMYGYPVNGE